MICAIFAHCKESSLFSVLFTLRCHYWWKFNTDRWIYLSSSNSTMFDIQSVRLSMQLKLVHLLRNNCRKLARFPACFTRNQGDEDETTTYSIFLQYLYY